MPQEYLLKIYKVLVRHHLDYGDIMYDQAYNASFHQKLESILHNATLAVSEAIRETSREELFRKLGLETLQNKL